MRVRAETGDDLHQSLHLGCLIIARDGENARCKLTKPVHLLQMKTI